MDSTYEESMSAIDEATEDAKWHIQSKDPCFKESRCVLKIPVHVFNYGRYTEIEAAKLSLRRKLLHYFREFDGYLLGFEDLQLATGHGIINDDSPYIIWPVSGTFYTFHAIEGAFVQATVKSFLGNCNNKVTCSISSGIIAVVSFPTPIPKKLSPFLHLSSTIIFQIDTLDSKFCQMSGKITAEAIDRMLKEAEKNS